MTKALRVGEFSLSDVVSLQSSDSWSVQYNPFLNGPGGRQGGTFIRSAVPWKGLTKADDETLGEYFDRLGETNAGASRGLSEIAQRLGATTETYEALQGETGVRLIKITRTGGEGMTGTRTVVVPTPAAVAAQRASNDDVHVEVVDKADNYNQLMQTNAQAREKIRMPAVY